MRAHTPDEAVRVVETIEEWQGIYRRALGRRLVFAADEYYLLAGREVPPARHYEGYPQHENGIGMSPGLRRGLRPPGLGVRPAGVRHGFFASVDAAPAEGYRAPAPAQRPGRDATSGR